MGLPSTEITFLYVVAVALCCIMVLLWTRMRRQNRALTETLNELGLTYDGQCRMWETRQQEMERVTSELTLAREQQEALLCRNISNRSTRKEVLGQLRAGTRPDSIAAKLELPRSEVRLLAKVQSVLADSIS